MQDIIGDLLPAALGVALSPVPIVAIVLVLGAPGARARGVAFAAGWVVGLSALTAVVTLVAGFIDDDGPSTFFSWLRIGVGLLFLGLVVKKWQQRNVAETPSWMTTLGTAPTGRIALIALAVSGLNPKNFALAATSASTIAQAELSSGATVGAAALFVAVGSMTVVGLVVLFLIAPRRSGPPLRTVETLMSDHGTVIMMATLLLLGAKLLGDGFAGL